MRPSRTPPEGYVAAGGLTLAGNGRLTLGLNLAGIPWMVVAAHGLACWVFTRARPTFGIKGWYAYSAAPGWHLARGTFLAVLLAPIVLFTVVGLPIVAFAHRWSRCSPCWR